MEFTKGQVKVGTGVTFGVGVLVGVGTRLLVYQASFRYSLPSQPAITQSLLLKVTLVWSDRAGNAAEIVDWYHVDPLGEYQTSFKGTSASDIPPARKIILSKEAKVASCLGEKPGVATGIQSGPSDVDQTSPSKEPSGASPPTTYSFPSPCKKAEA
jgi:hypothetical protein